MKVKLLILACCIAVLLQSGNALGQKKDKEKAKELWEKVIEAKGGRENLYAIENLVVSTKSYSPFEDEEFRNSKSEELFILSGKWWAWTDERPGFTLDIWQYDFEKEIGYEIGENSKITRIYKPISSPNSKVNRLELMKNDRFNFKKEQFSENLLIYLMETKLIQPKIGELKTIVQGSEKVAVIEVEYGKEKFEFYINQKKYLPYKVKMKTWIEETKTYFEDELLLENYIEVTGVKFPQVIRRSKKTDTKTTYQVNVKYDENLFSKPPSIEMGLDGWKPKQ